MKTEKEMRMVKPEEIKSNMTHIIKHLPLASSVQNLPPSNVFLTLPSPDRVSVPAFLLELFCGFSI